MAHSVAKIKVGSFTVFNSSGLPIVLLALSWDSIARQLNFMYTRGNSQDRRVLAGRPGTVPVNDYISHQQLPLTLLPIRLS